MKESLTWQRGEAEQLLLPLLRAATAGSQQLSYDAAPWQRGPDELTLMLMNWLTHTAAVAEISHHPDLPTAPPTDKKYSYTSVKKQRFFLFINLPNVGRF